MAISRRKAGNVVRCPKCAGEIVVRGMDGTQPADDDAQQPAATGLDDREFRHLPR